MNVKCHTFFWVRCVCGREYAAMVEMPATLDPMDSDAPQQERVSTGTCDVCQRSCTIRVTAEATPDSAWYKEQTR